MSALTDYAGGIRNVFKGAIDAFADPLIAMRAFAYMATLPGTDATSSLCRRFAISCIARIVPTIRLDSYDQARDLLDVCQDVIEPEIVRAGDAGEDEPCAALRAVLTAITEDLIRRGGSLAPLRSVDNPGSLPAAVLAQRLYRDGGRADEIVARSDAPHPLFVPTTFLAKTR